MHFQLSVIAFPRGVNVLNEVTVGNRGNGILIEKNVGKLSNGACSLLHFVFHPAIVLANFAMLHNDD